MFSNKTLGCELSPEFIQKLNDNFILLFGSEDIRSNFEILTTLLDKALDNLTALKPAIQYIDIPVHDIDLSTELKELFLLDAENKDIIKFYETFNNEKLIKPLSLENDSNTNIINLLSNFYINNALGGVPQIEGFGQKEVLEIFKHKESN